MEILLKEYSYEELNSSESLGLKKAFLAFKNELEGYMFAPTHSAPPMHKESSLGRGLTPSKIANPNTSSNYLKSVGAADIPKADLSEFKEESMGDRTYLSELVRLFKQNVAEFIGAFSVHMNNADWENLAFSAQKIKAGVSMVQANGLMGYLEELDVLLHSSHTPDKNQLHGLKMNFIQEYVLVETAIAAEMDLLGEEE